MYDIGVNGVGFEHTYLTHLLSMHYTHIVIL